MYGTTRPDVAGWDDAARETFLDLQFRAQRQEWEARFPDAEHDLILLGGRPVGRAWVAWSDDECVFVDLSLLPGHRRGGIGRQVTVGVLAEGDQRGVPVRATVERTNHASLAFTAHLGFVAVAEDDIYVAIERPVSPGLLSPAPG